MSLSRNVTGREFQRHGPATEKLMSPVSEMRSCSSCEKVKSVHTQCNAFCSWYQSKHEATLSAWQTVVSCCDEDKSGRIRYACIVWAVEAKAIFCAVFEPSYHVLLSRIRFINSRYHNSGHVSWNALKRIRQTIAVAIYGDHGLYGSTSCCKSD